MPLRLAPLHSLLRQRGIGFRNAHDHRACKPGRWQRRSHRTCPQYSTIYETGAKGLALSQASTTSPCPTSRVRYELFQNAPNGAGGVHATRGVLPPRSGAELGTDVGPPTFTTAYHSRICSRFRERHHAVGGNTIPGIPEHQLQASTTWHLAHAYVLGEVIAKSKVFVNDANAAAAPGFGTFNARIGGTAVFGRPWLSPVLGVQNVFDHHYIGSVAVNAAGATVAATKFYEPAPGRTWYLGLSAATNPVVLMVSAKWMYHSPSMDQLRTGR